jgi:hypothetical protein
MLKVTQRGSVQCVRELSSQEDHALRWAFGRFAAPEARAGGAIVVARYQRTGAGCWFLCDCLGRVDQPPALIPVSEAHVRRHHEPPWPEVGDFKNAGRELRPKGQPEPVRVHDFKIPELGRAAPYGIYDIAGNTGWVSVGIGHATASFAVNAIRRCWQTMGQARYPDASNLLITADCGGAMAPACVYGNESCKPWLLFSFITQNWRGKPLVSYQTIVQLIAATTTRTGLNVKCEIDPASYPAGIKVTNAEMAAINIAPHEFHGEWNYSIAPKPT